MTECLGSVLIVIFGAGVLIYYRRSKRKKRQEAARVWSELAQKTGLSFEPGKGGFFELQAPKVSGQYRGRTIRVSYVVKSTGWLSAFISNLFTSRRYVEERLYTETSLRVVNPRNLWVAAGERGTLARLVEKLGPSGAKVELDENYVVEGSSADLAQRIARILADKCMLLELAEEWVTMPDGAWTRPHIELNGSDLVCRQSGVITNADIQIALLNVFCDLADLVERMQTQVQPIQAQAPAPSPGSPVFVAPATQVYPRTTGQATATNPLHTLAKNKLFLIAALAAVGLCFTSFVVCYAPLFIASSFTPQPTPQVRLTPVDISELNGGVSAIAAGADHTCALMASGAVKCWGDNFYGQLGNGARQELSAADVSTPVDVIGLTDGVTAIAAGNDFSCALTTRGGVKCWGDNDLGRLGDGTTTKRLMPVDVSGLTSGVSAIAAGDSHTCVLTSAGGVLCWGDNSCGKLGDGTTTHRYKPVQVLGLTSGVSAITAGYSRTCALTASGGVKCWGSNVCASFGTTEVQNRPSDLAGLTSGVTAITAGGNRIWEGSHVCALTKQGGVKCWGENDAGQLGDGTLTDRPLPVDVSELTGGVSAIAAGGRHTCALTTSGGVKCWGDNYRGQLGDGGLSYGRTPVDVSGLASGVRAIAAGNSYTCALTTGGTVKCWGMHAWPLPDDEASVTPTTPADAPGPSGP